MAAWRYWPGQPAVGRPHPLGHHFEGQQVAHVAPNMIIGPPVAGGISVRRGLWQEERCPRAGLDGVWDDFRGRRTVVTCRGQGEEVTARPTTSTASVSGTLVRSWYRFPGVFTIPCSLATFPRVFDALDGRIAADQPRLFPPAATRLSSGRWTSCCRRPPSPPRPRANARATRPGCPAADGERKYSSDSTNGVM